MKLQGKVAIVTGGSRGIGFAIVESFVKEGAKVSICGSCLETAQKAVDNILLNYPNADVMPVGVNVRDTEEVKKMVEQVVEKWGCIDILVNNAGIVATKALIEMTDEDFTSIMDVNVTGIFKCTREVVKIMKERGGSIINTSSLVGTYGGKMQSAYGTSKFAVNGFTKSCAKELGIYNIRVNAVAPGVVETDMVAENVSEQMLQGLKQMTPLGKMAQPEELAGVYVYLASDDASFTTGAIFQVDGGLVL